MKTSGWYSDCVRYRNTTTVGGLFTALESWLEAEQQSSGRLATAHWKGETDRSANTFRLRSEISRYGTTEVEGAVVASEPTSVQVVFRRSALDQWTPLILGIALTGAVCLGLAPGVASGLVSKLFFATILVISILIPSLLALGGHRMIKESRAAFEARLPMLVEAES